MPSLSYWLPDGQIPLRNWFSEGFDLLPIEFTLREQVIRGLQSTWYHVAKQGLCKDDAIMSHIL